MQHQKLIILAFSLVFLACKTKEDSGAGLKSDPPVETSDIQAIPKEEFATLGRAQVLAKCGAEKQTRIFNKESVNWRTDEFTARNAYWFAYLSNISYHDYDTFMELLAASGAQKEGIDKWVSYLSKAFKTVHQLFGKKFDLIIADTQAMMLNFNDAAVVVFTGTNGRTDVFTDGLSWRYKTRTMGQVHAGFYASLIAIWPDLYRKLQAIRAEDEKNKINFLNQAVSLQGAERTALLNSVKNWRIPIAVKEAFISNFARLIELKKDSKIVGAARAALDEDWKGRMTAFDMSWRYVKKPIWLTGHSLGGSLAMMTGYRLMLQGFNVRGIYTFGAARQGDQEYARGFERLAHNTGIRKQLVRFVNYKDPISRVPPYIGSVDQHRTDRWTHVGQVKYLRGPEDPPHWPPMVDDHTKTAYLPQYLKDLGLFNLAEGLRNHDPLAYISKLEQLGWPQSKCLP